MNPHIQPIDDLFLHLRTVDETLHLLSMKGHWPRCQAKSAKNKG
jgi:hypothetical protein